MNSPTLPPSSLRRRLLLTTLVGPTLLLTGTRAAASPSSEPLTLLINEGATYRRSSESVRNDFKPIADDLSKLLRLPVQLELVSHYPSVAAALAKQRADIAFVHPAHIALAPALTGGYAVVAGSTAHLAYRAQFLARSDLNARSVADLVKVLTAPNAKPLGVPQAGSITDVLVRLTLREAAANAHLPSPPLKYSNYQDAMPTMIEHGFTDVAATGSESIAKAWAAAGGRIVAQSRPVPVKTVLVSSRLGREQGEIVRGYFVGLTRSTDGQSRLDRIGLPAGFTELEPAAIAATAKWLGSLAA